MGRNKEGTLREVNSVGDGEQRTKASDPYLREQRQLLLTFEGRLKLMETALESMERINLDEDTWN
jgi:hypothetical protein